MWVRMFWVPLWGWTKTYKKDCFAKREYQPPPFAYSGAPRTQKKICQESLKNWACRFLSNRQTSDHRWASTRQKPRNNLQPRSKKRFFLTIKSSLKSGSKDGKSNAPFWGTKSRSHPFRERSPPDTNFPRMRQRIWMKTEP